MTRNNSGITVRSSHDYSAGNQEMVNGPLANFCTIDTHRQIPKLNGAFASAWPVFKREMLIYIEQACQVPRERYLLIDLNQTLSSAIDHQLFDIIAYGTKYQLDIILENENDNRSGRIAWRNLCQEYRHSARSQICVILQDMTSIAEKVNDFPSQVELSSYVLSVVTKLKQTEATLDDVIIILLCEGLLKGPKPIADVVRYFNRLGRNGTLPDLISELKLAKWDKKHFTNECAI